MHRGTSVSFAIVFVSFGALGAAGCGGSVVEPGGGGMGGFGSSSSGAVSGSSGSTSGSPGFGGSSSGVSSSSSSGGPTTSPECVNLRLPALAIVCPDGSSAGGYYAWNGSQCVVAYQCPPVAGGSSSGVYVGPPSSSSSSSSGGYVSPAPPVCNFALPDICEPCSNGETVCAHYAIQNGSCVLEICPPDSPPVGGPPPGPPTGGSCSQGQPCQQGTGCGTASAGGYSCTESCNCDYTGYYQCTQTCPPPPPPPPGGSCSTGQPCMPGEGCGGGPDSNGCFENCSCSNYGVFECSYQCGFGGGGVAADAG